MKNHVIDNTIKNLGKTVLWQYDKAYRLLALLKHMQMLYHCAVTEFWDFWINKVLNIETCGTFGASMWGMFLGVPRPSVMNEDGTERLVATSVYRRILKGAFYLMKANSSYEDIRGYLEIVFGVMGKDNLSPWETTCSEYGWTTNDVNADGMTNGMWYLELIDSEGVVRKIGAAASDALSLSCSYKYGSKTITATATRTRKCGVTLTDNGDMSAEYGKSEWFDQMHKDQRDLFEQKKDEFLPYPLGVKTNEPVEQWVFGLSGDHVLDIEDMKDGVSYPRGTLFKADVNYPWGPFTEPHLWRMKWGGSNINGWRTPEARGWHCTDLGEYRYFTSYLDEGQENERYAVGVDYDEGHIFGFVDDAGHAFNYECLSTISGSENTSFVSIKGKVKKTRDGDPFIGRLYSRRVPDTANNVFNYWYDTRYPNGGALSCEIQNKVQTGDIYTSITFYFVLFSKVLVGYDSIYSWREPTMDVDVYDGTDYSLERFNSGLKGMHLLRLSIPNCSGRLDYTDKDLTLLSAQAHLDPLYHRNLFVFPSDVMEYGKVDQKLTEIAQQLGWKKTAKPGYTGDEHSDIASFYREG